MRIHVFGMGYVGCVSAACLSRAGHRVIGFDIDPQKVAILQQGASPIVEPGLNEAIAEAISSGCLEARVNEDLPDGDVSLICVGTPSRDNGSLCLDFLERVCLQIGRCLRGLDSYHVVNIRSTVLPGTIEEKLIPLLESESGKRVGQDFGVCMNPEFMREGSSLHDFYNPPFTVIGGWDRKSTDVVAGLYSEINAPLIRTSIRTAEVLKYACNAFHALKVAFANEIGNLCRRLGVDSHEVMDIFCQDTKLNLSPYYLKPGFAFGGSCLPKDLRALLYQLKRVDLEAPVLESILLSNRRQVDAAFKLVENTGKKKVGVLGLSFKPGSDDLRESPAIELVERLIGKGYEVSLYDPDVSLAQLRGANRHYVDAVIPHISSLMQDTLAAVIERADVIVVVKKSLEFQLALEKVDGYKVIVDLVRILEKTSHVPCHYEGICW